MNGCRLDYTKIPLILFARLQTQDALESRKTLGSCYFYGIHALVIMARIESQPSCILNQIRGDLLGAQTVRLPNKNNVISTVLEATLLS